MQADNKLGFEPFEIPVDGYKVRAYSLGSGDKVLMMIHGGPGFPSNYLQDSHAIFSTLGYRVVTWDQLGCGESDKPNDETLWNLPRFVEEVETVRQSLELGAVHLLGQSWGGALGLEYCLKYQDNIKSFIMANSTPSVPLMQSGFERLRLGLGLETCTMMSRREAEGSTHHPEYQAAATLLFYRHICRTENWSEAMQYCCNNIAKPVWDAMFGGQVFKCDGKLKHWDRSNDLAQLKKPVLIIQGEYDEIIPDCAALAHRNLPNSEFVLFRDCSHMPFYENPSLYQEVVSKFLAKY
ncbi:MAG: proline iminopeptidase-family hydrolase [Pseudomonadota bacterium]